MLLLVGVRSTMGVVIDEGEGREDAFDWEDLYRRQYAATVRLAGPGLAAWPTVLAPMRALTSSRRGVRFATRCSACRVASVRRSCSASTVA